MAWSGAKDAPRTANERTHPIAFFRGKLPYPYSKERFERASTARGRNRLSNSLSASRVPMELGEEWAEPRSRCVHRPRRSAAFRANAARWRKALRAPTREADRVRRGAREVQSAERA
jgi:hypothetical protein